MELSPCLDLLALILAQSHLLRDTEGVPGCSLRVPSSVWVLGFNGIHQCKNRIMIGLLNILIKF